MKLRIQNIVLMLFLASAALAQSPHGKDFNVNCAVCHNAESWDFLDDSKFDHDTTHFQLIGQHREVNCTNCHQTLVFNEAKTNCASCHTNQHQSNEFNDCERCHTNNNWMVTNIAEIHQQSRFPLLGAHLNADCYQCHISGNNLEFKVLSTECFSCHKTEYFATTSPNHVQENYSTNCEECHLMTKNTWSAAGFNHGFFPLTQGHDQLSCKQCHVAGTSVKISSECASCHTNDFNNTSNPNHQSLGFSTNCIQCHTTAIGWAPAEFTAHDQVSFPIYSGSHRGEWKNCTECHTNPSNYQQFTCTDCHEHNKSSMDRRHNEERNYKYESNACYSCHPRGRAEDD